MERWKEERIDEIIGRHGGSSYGLAIRLQQQFGMSWREAIALAGYGDFPSHTSKLPSTPILTPEEKAADERIVQEIKETLRQHVERLKKDPVERINELMEQMKAREQLLSIKDNLLKGVGEVDDKPTIIVDDSPEIGLGEVKNYCVSYSSNPPLIGVLMLRVPCLHRVYIDALRSSKSFDDFASIRVGVYLPFLPKNGPATYEADQVERIGVQVRNYNLELYSSMSPDSPLNNQKLWKSRSSQIQHSFDLKNIYPQYPSPDQLNTLLMRKIKEHPFS